ncbi:MAG: T9SS type A sorting domain-containing protein [Prevotellaceae bacterium]|jgi:myo-inositol-hexaphosphate 3-phosphohydrolase|nr:T9SS type A sorting domain-containing protein [Prevotellaceae bacterium]
MKLRYYFLMFFSGMALSVSSQRVEYTYDNAGNRLTRTIILPSTLRSAAVAVDEEPEEEPLPQQKVYSDHLNQTDILIYPNPTKGLLRVKISGNAENKPVGLQVYDASGRVLLQESNAGSSTILDLSNQPSGIYMLRLVSDREKKEWKIIKE